MTWPTEHISRANMDAGTKNPADAREDLLDLIDAVNSIMDSRGVANGIAALGANGLVSALDPDAVLSAILEVDGSDSSLDAATVAGKSLADLVLNDGTNGFALTGSNKVNILHTGSTSNTVVFPLSLVHETSSTPAAGFGIGILFQAETAQGGYGTLGDISIRWSDPNVNSADSYIRLRATEASSVVDQLILSGGYMELRIISAPGGGPDAGRGWLYVKSDGVYSKLPGAAEVKLSGGEGGVTNHNQLSNLEDDDHPHYFMADGSRTAAGPFNFSTYAPIFGQLGGNPSTPSAGNWRLFFKSGGLYTIDSSGTVVGPFETGAATDHGALSGLGDNDHTQYLLRQPQADSVINDDGSDFDFRIEGNTAANLFFLDAGLDRVFINSAAGLTGESRFNVVAGASSHGIYASSQTADYHAIRATTSVGNAIYAEATGIGRALYVKNTSATSDGPLAEIDCTSDPRSPGLLIHGDGPLFEIWGDSEANIMYVGAEMSVWYNQAMVSAFTYRVNTITDEFLYVDAERDAVRLGGGRPYADTGTLQVTPTTQRGIYVNSSTLEGLRVLTSSGTGVVSQTSTGIGVEGVATQPGGRAGYFYRSTGSAGSNVPVFKAEITNAADDGVVAQFTGIGAGNILQISDESNMLFSVDPKGTLVLRHRDGGDVGATPPSASHWSAYCKEDGFFVRASTGARRLIATSLYPDAPGMIPVWDDDGNPFGYGEWSTSDKFSFSQSTVGNRNNSVMTWGLASPAGSTDTISSAITIKGEVISLASGSSKTCFSVGPGWVIGVFVHNETAVSGPTSYDVGVDGDTSLFLQGIDVADETKTTLDDFKPSSPVLLSTAKDVVITASGGNFSGGSVVLSVHYIQCSHV